MSKYDLFTVPELYLISIFAEEDRDTTVYNLMSAIPDFDDKEVISLAEGVIVKLDGICDDDFSDWNFPEYDEDFADEYEE